MKLSINSSDNKRTLIRLDEREYTFEYDSPRRQNVLGAITDAIAAEGKDLTDLTEIEVFTGPGSFTGLRSGVAIANALSFALTIPINGQPAGTTIIPNYGKEPSITPPKKKDL